MIKCFHITVTEVREGSCFCDVPAALYSVFKNCYMNITDMHLLNVSADIGTLNPMLFEPEKYTKHSRGVIQPELHVQHHRLYLKDFPTRLHKQWRDTCSHSLCSQHKPQKADWEWCAQLSHNTFSKTEKSSPSTIHTHTCTPTHTPTQNSAVCCVGIQVSVQGRGSYTWSPSLCFGLPCGYTNHDFTPCWRVRVCKSFMEPCWCLPVDSGLNCTAGSSLCESARGLLTRWMVHCVWSLCVHTAAVSTHVNNDCL